MDPFPEAFHPPEQMNRALNETRLYGIQSTVDFHHWLIHHPEFIAAEFTTKFFTYYQYFILNTIHAETHI